MYNSFKNNLPGPRVEDRYRLIKEYHESAIGGHKGMTKTYDKLAHEYYWRAMQADVRRYTTRVPRLPNAKISANKDQTPNDNKRHTSKAI